MGRVGVGARVCSAVLVVTTLAVSGCSSTKHSAQQLPVGSMPTRWWSNSAVQVGSTISPSDPTAAAGQLSASRAEYCQMLKQTLAVGKSVLPSANAADPKLLPTTEAFVSEIQAVAPSGVAASWKVLAPVILQLVRAGGSLPTSGNSGDANNLRAAEAINSDSVANCHLDLSAVVTGH